MCCAVFFPGCYLTSHSSSEDSGCNSDISLRASAQQAIATAGGSLIIGYARNPSLIGGLVRIFQFVVNTTYELMDDCDHTDPPQFD